MNALFNSSGKLPIKIIIIAVLVLVLAAGAFAFLKMNKGGKSQVKKADLTEWKLEGFLVNLADENVDRYLKADLVLSVAMKGDQKKASGAKEGTEAANPEEARAKDAIISVLRSKHYSELLSTEAEDKLKEQLNKRLNKSLESCTVEYIYFTYFAMQ